MKDILKPVISVIMAIHNENKQWIKASIDSVLNQSYQNFEFIIINDNPKRVLNNNILNSYSDDRIIVINNEKNIGLTKSLNKGLKLSCGEFIARMDADDISLKYRLENQLEFFLENNDIGVCGSSIELFGEKKTIKKNIKQYPLSNKEIKTEFLFSNPVCHPAVMFRRSIFINNGIFYYDEEIKKAQDFDIWFRVLKFTKYINIDKVLLKYRVSSNQISAVGKKEQDYTANKIRKNLIEGLIKSTDYEILLHNKVCNSNCKFNEKEIRSVEKWFNKLSDKLLDSDSICENHLEERLNFYLQKCYLNSFPGISKLRYFKTNMFLCSKRKIKYSFLFMMKLIRNN